MALLCVNRFELPLDVIDIIKSLAFYDLETAKWRHIKNMNIRRIGCAHTNKGYFMSEYYTPYHYWHRVHGEIKWMNCIFCKKCGNYSDSYKLRLELICCNCN